MYERNAIVLERYFEKKFGFDKANNLKTNYINFSDLLEELEKYQIAILEEENIIQEFDEIAQKIQIIQKKQEKLCATNEKLEEERNRLFNLLDENPSTLENKLEKIENALDKNNDELKKLRIEFIESLEIFTKQQIQRNKCAKEKRIAETNHVTFIQKVSKMFQELNQEDIQNAKNFLNTEKETIEYEVYQILMKNGKNEKVEFYVDAMQIAAKARIKIAEKEIECYLTIYEKLKKILQEIESDNLKLTRYQKTLRDADVKLAFLKAEKEYIVGFLDNERMVAINGIKVHQKMMEEACHNFETDMTQISNLYELILREIAGKSTKKAYKELYNKTYLKEIEDKERNFEEEVNHIKIPMGTVINSNYWRIEGIKNIYNVFQEEVSEKFAKDLSEFRIEEPEEVEELVGVKSTQNIKIFEDEEDSYDLHKNEYEEDNEDDYDSDEEYDEDYEDDYDNEEEYDEDYEDDYDNEEEYDEDEDDNDKEYDDYEDDEYEDDDDWDDEYEEELEDEFDDEDEEDEYEYEDDEEYEDDDEEEYDDEEWDDDEDIWKEKEEKDDIWDEETEEKQSPKRKNKKVLKNEKTQESEETEESKGIFNKFFRNKKK